MRWVRLLSATLVAALAFSVQPAAPAQADSTPASWATTCEVDGLEFAPTLDTDRRNDGTAIAPTPSAGGSYVPVIYVHGWVSTSKHVAGKGVFSAVPDLSVKRAGGTPDFSRSLIGNVQELPGAAVYTFDYERYASRWVTDGKIGASLAQGIDCLFEHSGEKVIVVGHSMGGLATRQALSEIPDLQAKISQVITFGTPNTGSVIAAILAVGVKVGGIIPGAPGRIVTLLRAWLAHCGNSASHDLLEPSFLCSNLLPKPLTSFDSEAAQALRSGSPELSELPSWPQGLPVHALAGEIRFDIPGTGFFRSKKKESFGIGDGVVTLDSATNGATAAREITCTYDLEPTANIDDLMLTNFWKVKTKDEVSRNSVDLFFTPVPCLHGNLMRETNLANEEFGLIVEDISNRINHCTEESFRTSQTAKGTKWLSLDPNESNFVYSQFTMHSCQPPYALIEVSTSSGSLFDYWVMRLIGNIWRPVAVSSVGICTPLSEPLFTETDLSAAFATDGNGSEGDVEVDAYIDAVGGNTQSGRQIVDSRGQAPVDEEPRCE